MSVRACVCATAYSQCAFYSTWSWINDDRNRIHTHTHIRQILCVRLVFRSLCAMRMANIHGMWMDTRKWLSNVGTHTHTHQMHRRSWCQTMHTATRLSYERAKSPDSQGSGRRLTRCWRRSNNDIIVHSLPSQCVFELIINSEITNISSFAQMNRALADRSATQAR